ncbi:MAG: mannose-1-phosphate guanylyltransferase/mannose-6-phosphate isomerase [Gammaproteobacteria bacterium]|nr:mannose-1-phosphate guanylyltransferase/mannose-6-phosphate isomerase [Gammaproteobacteria bacterium]
MNLVPVILCGGSGTRLWPLSRALYPKQLLALVGRRSLLQDTVARLALLPGESASKPLVVCNEAHRFLVAAQLTEAGARPTVILEPEGRNTAPAAAIAALAARRQAGADVLLLVLPADHVLRDPSAFAAAVALARPAAAAGKLVTFGVVPTQPETGYGYIRTEAPGEGGVQPVREFVEKPDYETAQRYVNSGAYLWNSGMFLFSADTYLRELEVHAPDIALAANVALDAANTETGFLTLQQDSFRQCRKESIDYAVMEKTGHAVVVPLSAGWSDVGSWAALLDVCERDAQGNVLAGDVVAVECTNSYVRAESRLVAVTGLDECIVVETKDAVLVATKSHAQDVKKIVEELDRRRRPETKLGREVFRPWGSYDSLDGAAGFQVKRLTVLPGAVLSLQLHHQRAEHWVVVSGMARITRNDEVFDLTVGEYTFIPLGARHRIENPGSDILRIIEVQVGDYLGEDDIVRFEDRYGRQGRTA